MSVDLYKALGLAKDATRDQIRKAYRQAAKKAHPDGGGSRESFDLVRLAVDTLTDDERRKHYDETGDVGEKAIDNKEALALTIAMNAIDRVLNTIAQRGGNPAMFKVIDDAIINLKMEYDNVAQQIYETKEAAKRVRATSKRFKAKRGKTNRITQIFLARADEMDRNAKRGEGEMEKIDLALKILAEHDWEVEPYPSPTMIFGGPFIVGNMT